MLRYLSTAATTVLVVLSGLGFAETTRGLSSQLDGEPQPAQADAVVGVPLQGARDVTAIRALLARQPDHSAARWVVLYPPEVPPNVPLYVRYQLAHLLYPQRVDVVNVNTALPQPRYTGVITAPGVFARGMGQPVGMHSGFALYLWPAT